MGSCLPNGINTGTVLADTLHFLGLVGLGSSNNILEVHVGILHTVNNKIGLSKAASQSEMTHLRKVHNVVEEIEETIIRFE